ncbi:MAG: GspH/FimT family pseudopilin [Candidatus Rokuibacteriota bacterium]
MVRDVRPCRPGPLSGRERGYTAIEMMIVALVISLILFSSITWIGDVIQTNRAKSAAQQIASAFQAARQYAVSNGARYTVTLTASPPRVTITCSLDCPRLHSETFDIINEATTSIPPPITFEPMGTSLQPGTVDVTYPGAPAWQVRVTGAGGIRACSPACT